MGDMTESNNTKKPTREELTAILSRFGSKDMTGEKGGGVIIVGGVRPPRQPDESMKKPEEH
jgi:hypothetical protein